MATDTLINNPLVVIGTKEQLLNYDLGENDFGIATDEIYKPDVVLKELTESLVLTDNVIFNGEVSSSLTVKLPENFDASFLCQINFSSGSTATAFTAPETIKWDGDDITEGAFVPVVGKRYILMFYSDGVNLRAISQGV